MKKFIITIIILLSAIQLQAIEVSHKQIEFFVDHTAQNVTGICNEIQIENPNLQSFGGQYRLRSPFEIKIPILKITSGDSGRDSHMHEILGSPEFQVIHVKVESINQSKTNLQIYAIKGKLTIRGKSKEFVTDANVQVLESGLLHVNGTLGVKFSDFELENPTLLFMKAKDVIQVKYQFDLRMK
ncbi:YceI family protein [Leptospira bouyouniensis]|uniref:YceI family protein n=1 Tax=Leptospira bouyouniensis TaxID=2484911 RepID=A0A7I0HUG8_9LEPT|nr:YceI family protein [Leptospira bouyouniensis]TGL07835.1 YceI family protein [Leptospira bouyouniensis]